MTHSAEQNAILDIIQKQEKLTSDMVQFMVDLNDALISQGHLPSARANQLLDRYFSLQDQKNGAKNG